MSTETLILLGLGYLGFLVLMLSVLAAAKRSDETLAWDAAKRMSDEEPPHRDVA